MTSSAQTIATFAGGNPPPTPLAATSASVGAGRGVAVDSSGNLYFNTLLHCTFRVDPGGNLTRVAGTCRPGYAGDGGAATAAQLNLPDGVAVDAGGNVFIADRNNHRVRKVTTSGVITTVAGTGKPGYSGDNGTGTAAQLNSPAGLAFDASGNLYIADSNNNVIRKLSPAGVITTVAGNGTAGFSGDGGSAVSAQLTLPQGVSFDTAGNLYIADSGNNRIREVSGTAITTVAGNGALFISGDGGSATAAGTLTPYDVAAAAPGVFYLTSAYGVRKVSGGIINTVAGTGTPGFSGDGGPGTSAQLSFPYGLGLDLAGNLYIADTGNYRIRKLASGGTISTVAGSGSLNYSGDGGPAAAAQIASPASTAADASGNVYIADAGNNRVRKVSASGIITTLAGNGGVGNSGDSGAATSAQVGSPSGLAVDSSGNVYISVNYGVRKVTPGGIISTVAGTGTPGYSGDGGAATRAQLNNPAGLAVDASGNLFVADSANSRVRVVSPGGVITSIAGNGLSGYSGDGGAATSAELSNPTGVALDSAGNLYIADLGNNRVRKVAGGVITTVAGNGTPGYTGDGGAATAAELNQPSGVAVDTTGNLLIADQGNNRVREVAGGTITTLAGTGTAAYSGDGGPANTAAVDLPAGVSLDNNGHLYIADWASNAVRVVSLPTSLAVMTNPANGSALTSSSVMFQWTAGAATQFSLWIGSTGAGSSNLFVSSGTATSATAVNLPTDGRTLNVRLWCYVGGAWQFNDYTYTAASNTPSTITSPANHSTLTGASVTFQWTGPAGVQNVIWIGSTGLGSSNLFVLGPTTATSATPAGLPTTGGTIYVRLWTFLSGSWQYNDYSYTAASGGISVMTSPVNLSTLSGPAVTFQWSGPAGVQNVIWIGSTGVGSSNLFVQGPSVATSASPTHLPADGSTIYVRLWTLASGSWQSNDYTYTAAAGGLAVMTSPANLSTLAGSSQLFQWTTGTGVSQYVIWIGSTGAGSANLFVQGPTTSTSVTATGLPVDGRTLYVRLWSLVSAGWQYNDYTYTAF